MADLDLATGTITNGGITADVTSVNGGQVVPIEFGQGLAAWVTREQDENANLNLLSGDADLTDRMVSVFHAPTATMATNIYAGVAQILSARNNRVFVSWTEAAEGPVGTAINPADADALDTMFGYVDPSLLVAPFDGMDIAFWPNAAPPGSTALERAGAILAAFHIDEAADGAADLNGDGDAADTMLGVGDAALPAPGPANLNNFVGAGVPVAVDPTAAFELSLSNWIGFYADEVASGGADVDLSGGVGGFPPCVYDVAGNVFHPLGSPAGFLDAGAGAAVMIYDANTFLHTAMEAPRLAGALGTNNDGDAADQQILYWGTHVVLPVTTQPLAVNLGGGLTALALDGGGTAELVTPGWVSLVVHEAANNNFDLNGNGVVDLALLFVDLNTIDPVTLSPTVYNPQIVPSAMGNIPLTGLFGNFPAFADQGLVVRLLEVQNGDLNGDLDNTDTLLAFVSFTNPGTVTVLGVGGDQVVVAGGLIGVTVNEAYTQEDVALNGGTTDFVFCLLEPDATRVTARLCSQHSIPASDTGDTWAFLRSEVAEARDLNGDLDQIDFVLGLHIR
jgi:hypothetical protein